MDTTSQAAVGLQLIEAGQRVTVRVPATSANLGPGYDSLGLALALHDTLTVESLDTKALAAFNVKTDYARALLVASEGYRHDPARSGAAFAKAPRR